MKHAIHRAVTLLLALTLLAAPVAPHAETADAAAQTAAEPEVIEYQNFSVICEEGELRVAQDMMVYYADPLEEAPGALTFFTLAEDYETLLMTYERENVQTGETERVFVSMPHAGDVLLEGRFEDIVFVAEMTDVRLDLDDDARVGTMTVAAPLMLEIRGELDGLYWTDDVELLMLGYAAERGSVQPEEVLPQETLDLWTAQLAGEEPGAVLALVDWARPVEMRTEPYTVTVAYDRPAPVTYCSQCGEPGHKATLLPCGEYVCKTDNPDDPIHWNTLACGKHYACTASGNHGALPCGVHYACQGLDAAAHGVCSICGKGLCSGDHGALPCGAHHACQGVSGSHEPCAACGQPLCSGDHSLLPCGAHHACQGVGDASAHGLCEACGKGLCSGDHSLYPCGVHHVCQGGDAAAHEGTCTACGQPLCSGDHSLLPCGAHHACQGGDASSHGLCTACGQPLCSGDHSLLPCGAHHACQGVGGSHELCSACGQGLCSGDHSLLPCGVHHACQGGDASSHGLCGTCNQPLCSGDHSLLPCGAHHACQGVGGSHELCSACGQGLCSGDHSLLPCGVHHACQGGDASSHGLCGTCNQPLCNGQDHTACGGQPGGEEGGEEGGGGELPPATNSNAV